MSKVFIPHKYQSLAIGHMTSRQRSNLFMSPGMGKSSCTMTTLDICNLVEDVYPALVVGPLRVANSVWTRECDKWAHLNKLRVSKVLGTLTDRTMALARRAEIYTINYDNLDWLRNYFDGKPWPFKTIIADESTRIKNHRCSLQKSSTGKVFMKRGGGVNASALMLKASQSPRYHNLTGTPAPNGLQDLWGQQFSIDFGATLGQSYTAFTTRWFRQKPGSQREQAIFEPLDHAESEITRRIAPSTISLDAYDWFDVEKPREVDIAIELTDKLKAQYKTLHQDAVLKLSDEATITAVNAGVITAKCLQFASGSIFDENGVPHNVHDLKLDALDSLRENLCGAPLLVAYHWKPDREKILKKFKDAVVLPSGSQQKVVEDLWNAGKIPMLLVHPQSAGHGLDLQHGGHNLCMYSLQWDLELYQQVIERIGPVRQKQAGYDRLVNVYRLITVGTFDSTVAMRLKTKCSVQDAVTQAVRG